MAASRPAFALFGALALYGFLSAPAPASVRLVEAVIGGLLVAAVGVARPLSMATGHALRDPSLPPLEAMGTLSFLVLLWVPTLRGAALGWEAEDMLRDVVPLLYLFLPVLLAGRLRRAGPGAAWILAGGLALAGLLFALRWWRQAEWGFGAVGTRAMGEGTRYFLNSPSVLFAAIALPGAAAWLLAAGGVWRRVLALGALAGGLLCVAALAGAVHRMALGVAVLAFAATAPWWWRRAPRLVMAAMGLGGVAAVALGDTLIGTVAQVSEKSRLHGANARFEEMGAVLELVGRSPLSLLFGEGWGAVFANPAVGGWLVSYTHTLAGYVLLKAGLVGLVALAAYLASLAPAALALLRANPPLGWAILPPLIVSLGMHTSFKYLDCGLLLTLVVVACKNGSYGECPTGGRA